MPNTWTPDRMTSSMTQRKFSFSKSFFAGLSALTLVLAACGAGEQAQPAGPTAPPADAVTINILYGSEKRDWLEDVTKTFNGSNIKTSGGKTIVVQTEPIGSLESVTEILDGRKTPTIWSPASRVSIPILNDGWVTKNGTDLIKEQCRDAVLSPVVVMMWKPFAEALGWPNTPIGWADIAKIATSPNGWADYGHPEWGDFRFGHTHPEFSNSGLQTIIAMSYAAQNKVRGLTVEDVKKPETAAFLNQLESRIAHYGSSTGFFGDAMIERGPTYLSAAVVYENIVAGSYSEAKQKIKAGDGFPLVAIYPKEGTFQTDHPLCIPDASWVSAEQRDAANIYRDYLLSRPVQEQALKFGFRPASPDIPIGAPLDAANGVDPKQPQSVLQVPSAGVTREIRALWSQQKRQVNVTMVIDVSGSMRNENRIQGAREGATAFIDRLNPTDTLSIIIFDDQPTTLYTAANVGTDREAMKRAVANLIPDGGTALYDSIGFAVENFALDPNRINALVVMTDGEDTDSSKYNPYDKLSTILGGGAESEATGNILVFTIGYGSGANEDILKNIAKLGRGAYRKGTNADIAAVYREISTFF